MSLDRFNLRVRLIVSIIAVLFFGLSVLTGYSYWKGSRLIQAEAFAKAEEMAEKYAREINARFDATFTMARSMAAMFQAAKENKTADRQTLIRTQEKLIKDDELLHGIGGYFEPNALDGQDAHYKGRYGASDSGRFAYWLNRKPDGSIAVSASRPSAW